MIKKEEWVLIRGLANLVKEGLSISEIARQTGHDRKTIRKHLLAEERPHYSTVKRLSKLDPYKEYIRHRLQEVPEIAIQRILREIKEKGYRGSRSILGDFMGPLREEKVQEAVIRFETMPGEQSQVDWSPFGTIAYCGVKRRLYCFCMVLGFSRMLYLEFTLSQDIFNFLTCHQNAFLYFGGYTRTILYDNLKTVVLSRVGSNVAWNTTFMDFAGFYGFHPKLCRLARAQTKGKVERPFHYIWQDFFIGTKFEDIEELNQKALHWLNTVANNRVHGTTKEVPFERLKQEQLLPLKDRLYDTSYSGARKASADCFISYEGNRYSVPSPYSRKTLSLRADREKLKVYALGKDEPIAVHALFKGRGKDITDPRHLEGIKAKQREKWQAFKEAFLCLSPLAKDYWEGFLSSPRMRGRWWELRKVLSLCEHYSAEEVDYAFKRALHYQAFGYRSMEGILRNSSREPMSTPEPLKGILQELLIKQGIPQVEERSLKVYEECMGEVKEEQHGKG